MAMMTKDDLQADMVALLDEQATPIEEMSLERLWRLITVTQHVTDLLLNEIERRGELTFHPEDGTPIVPYLSNYEVPTILTRGDG